MKADTGVSGDVLRVLIPGLPILARGVHDLLGKLAEQMMSCRCGNVAAILELDEHLNKSFKVSSSPVVHKVGRPRGCTVLGISWVSCVMPLNI